MKKTGDKMIKVCKTLVAGAVALTLGAGVASATTVHATSITVGTTTVTTATSTTTRSDLGNALGASDAYQSGSVYGGFYSLGIGGSAVFGFGTNFGAPGSVVEVTAGSRSSHLERITVEAFNIMTSVWEFVGLIDNQGPTSLTLAVSLNLAPGAAYSHLRLTDTSPVVQGRDGWDIDSISVSAVPLPAAGFLLIGALGGLAALRRRKTA